MKNVVLIVVFVIMMNTLLVIGIDALHNQSQDALITKSQIMVESMKIESQDIPESQILVGTQSQYSTDLMPPVDTNNGFVTILNKLWNGISVNIPDDMLNTQWEKTMFSWVQWLIWLINITCIAWGIIWVTTKIVHT